VEETARNIKTCETNIKNLSADQERFRKNVIAFEKADTQAEKTQGAQFRQKLVTSEEEIAKFQKEIPALEKKITDLKSQIQAEVLKVTAGWEAPASDEMDRIKVL
jgi:chromosome segregation ATPase